MGYREINLSNRGFPDGMRSSYRRHISGCDFAARARSTPASRQLTATMGLGYSRIYETLLSQPLSFRKLPVSLFGSRAWSRFPKITPADAAASHECMPGVGQPYHSAGEGHLHAMWTVPMTNRILLTKNLYGPPPYSRKKLCSCIYCLAGSL